MSDTNSSRTPRIGLALGSGSARGWSHIGVIDALAELGIRPDVVCGASIGALVGAAYAAGNIDKLEQWVRSLTRLETARFFEINSSLNGFVNTDRLHGFLNQMVADDEVLIENCGCRYAAVATDLETGREIWLTEGQLIEAVWASMSLPGLFPTIEHEGRWLVDGGLVNPVPVSVCRALGAEIVIAVNLNGDIVGRHARKSRLPKRREKPERGNGIVGRIGDLAREYTDALFSNDKKDNAQPPGLFEAIAGSVNITQDRITRSRMAGDPPELMIAPALSHIGLLEFYRAEEAIEEGRTCVQRTKSELARILEIG